MSQAQKSAPALKQCCAQLYESDIAKWLLGESFHPGGLALTRRLGDQLQLQASDRVLDVASGQGATALFLAERFGCKVVGIDYSAENVRQANAEAGSRNLSALVRFERADAESMPFPDSAFDALVCECSFCTFPDKRRAAGEFARVLRPGGRLGLSDLTRAVNLSEELTGLLAWISCIAAAQPIDGYVEVLRASGFIMGVVESHDRALQDLMQQVRTRLLAIEVVAGLKHIELPMSIDVAAAKRMIGAAARAIERGELGYVLMTAERVGVIIG